MGMGNAPICNQMLRKVAVMDAGESDFLPGRQVNRFEFEDAANALIAEGKEPPVVQRYFTDAL